MIVSLREAAIAAERCLVGAGMDRGCAGDATRLVLVQEIEHGVGLAQLERQLEEPGERLRGRLRRSYLELDAGGRSSLLAGPVAVDLAIARATHQGVGYVEIRNVTSAAFAPGLLHFARQRGWRSAVGVWLDDPEGAPWLTGDDPAGLDRAAHSVAATVGLLCLRPGAGSVAASPGEERGYGPFLTARASRWATAREDAALRRGIEVDDARWGRLSAAAGRVLTAESERSRADAGPYSGEPAPAGARRGDLA